MRDIGFGFVLKTTLFILIAIPLCTFVILPLLGLGVAGFALVGYAAVEGAAGSLAVVGQ